MDERVGHESNHKQPFLYLPPPPEHPPPSDIGSPPDSPTDCKRRGDQVKRSNAPNRRSPLLRSQTLGCDSSNQQQSYIDCGQQDRSRPLRDLADRRGPLYDPVDRSGPLYDSIDRCRPFDSNKSGYQSATNDDSQSPNSFNDVVADRNDLHRGIAGSARSGVYSPRAMSEPEYGPSSTLCGYRLIPIADNELHKHFSDTDGALVQPHHMNVSHEYSPPSPAPEDPVMHRAHVARLVTSVCFKCSVYVMLSCLCIIRKSN